MGLLFASFVAGMLTVLSPCIVPLLPAVLGGAATTNNERSSRFAALFHPLVVTISLAVSVFTFTLLLRASTAFLGVPTTVWYVIAGTIVVLLGITYLFPSLWDKLASRFNARANRLLGQATQRRGVSRDIMLGAALGPAFSSCSPTYAFIIAVVLPQSFAVGVVNIAAYTLGLALLLFLIALFGQHLVRSLRWAANPHGWFRRIIGVLFIFIGLFIILGGDRALQTFIIDQGWYAPIEELERRLRPDSM